MMYHCLLNVGDEKNYFGSLMGKRKGRKKYINIHVRFQKAAIDAGVRQKALADTLPEKLAGYGLFRHAG